MATLFEHPSLKKPAGNAHAGHDHGYEGYKEPDTKIPPKARPVLDSISVDGIAIPEADILAEAQNHPADNPGAAIKAAARALVVRQLLLNEARRIGLVAEPVADGEARIETEEDSVIRQLVEAEIDVPSANEEECRRYHQNHAARFRSEDLYEVRHILIAARKDDPEAWANARTRAEGIITHLADHPNEFASLAETFSDCPSRHEGGNLGQIGRGQTVAEFEAALSAMQPGETSVAPVESPFGFHVIALDRKIEGRPLPFEAAKPRIAAWLEAQAWSRAISQYVSILAGRADIKGIDIAAADGPLIQ
jgi:peptidyl-prolyl cis-trans isomerase C